MILNVRARSIQHAACDNGAENLTAEHILAHCPLFSPSHGITGLVRLDAQALSLGDGPRSVHDSAQYREYNRDLIFLVLICPDET